MAVKFSKNFAFLQKAVAECGFIGNWIKLNPNQIQFHAENGAILDWYPSTGTIRFGGDPRARDFFRTKVLHELRLDFPPNTDADVIEDSPADPKPAETCVPEEYLGHKFGESELVLALVGAVGTQLRRVSELLMERLKAFGYTPEPIQVSDDVIAKLYDMRSYENEGDRINDYMDKGDDARSFYPSILALGAAAKIAHGRDKDNGVLKHRTKHCYIINSLKHPEEVAQLREIYGDGFYLIGVFSDVTDRLNYLTDDKQILAHQANFLIEKDADEQFDHGQHSSDTFHLADFFVYSRRNREEILKKSLWRILDILFGHPNKTPTFDEYAMFLAFAASLRSADLSRQVGAVIANGKEILATGANDCPRPGGGLYWPELDRHSSEIRDARDGRDYMRGEDSNTVEKRKIIEGIVEELSTKGTDRNTAKEVLHNSRINDITEYGRVVHAEMEALMCCARNNISARGAVLYCTTFPCHNCAKHIVAAGIKRVVYVEPYPKSRAAEHHSDSISMGILDDDEMQKVEGMVRFEPFIGVGPRRFFDLFSMRLGSGFPLKRKNEDGTIKDWTMKSAKLRTQILPCSYLERELLASDLFNNHRKEIRG